MKIILKILGICSLSLLCTCADLERDNILDPKNPNSERSRIVLIEAFVSDDPNAQFCGFALDGLTNLQAEFEFSQIILLEYHLLNNIWQDQHAVQDANVRYAELAEVPQGVPDIFFNGADSRVQGASSVDTAYLRYRNEFEDESNEPGLYTIEAQTRAGSNSTEVDVSLARLGNTDVANISLHAVVVHDMGTAHHHHVVKSVLVPKVINKLGAGQISTHTFSVPSSLAGANNAALVVFVYDDNAGNKKVLQALYLTL